MILRKVGLALALSALAATTMPSLPASADGAASTRNIILGGALVGGTLLILNHNKKVHQKEDEISNARDQARATANQEAAAADSYHQQLVQSNRALSTLKHTVAVQHTEIVTLRQQVALAQKQSTTNTAFLQPVETKPVGPQNGPVRVAAVSYGWGAL